MYILTEEPLPGITASEFKAYFAEKQSEKDFADAYALLHAKFVWVEDEIYDYEEGTTAYEYACTVAEEWECLYDEYEQKILAILKSEGVSVPETGYIKVIKPFMARNGYDYRDGWWIKKERLEGNNNV